MDVVLDKDALEKWIGAISLDAKECDELTEDKVWTTSWPVIWKAKRFVGSPAFFPVYRWRNYYSFSPLRLLLKKGSFELDLNVARRVNNNPVNYLSCRGTLDREIKRVGGPMVPKFRIRQPEQYVRAIAEALKQDMARIEEANPGYTNAILCGGKDSLNLLFLPWKNPVVVVSAAPSYLETKRFIDRYSLPFDVIELKDGDKSMLPQEILINFCRNNLEHCRWGPELAQIARQYDAKIIFWKGQVGGRLMNPRWATYTDPLGLDDWNSLTGLCALLGGRGEIRIRKILKDSGITQHRTFRAYWKTGAMWQGAHLSFLRELTGALTLSAYHGPRMRRVVEQVDLNRAVPYDVRPLLGEQLYGRPVKYPADNHGPKPSVIRRGISKTQTFLDVLHRAGIPNKKKG